MKCILLIFSLIFIGEVSIAQNRFISPVTIDKKFKDTLSFDDQWSYLYYVGVDSKGNLKPLLASDSLRWQDHPHRIKMDTAHSYHTANCSTNYKNEKQYINYCEAIGGLYKGVLNLAFSFPQDSIDYSNLQGSSLLVSVYNNKFECTYDPPYYSYKENNDIISWNIKKQKLILNKKDYNLKKDSIVKGYIEIEFTINSRYLTKEQLSETYYFKGYFKTPLIEDNDASCFQQKVLHITNTNF